MLIREFISIVRNNLNSISLDSNISGEYIYNVGLSISKLLIKRESDSRRLFKNTNNFTFIDCVKMEESSIIKCTNVSIPNCKKVMRSVEPLPEAFSSIYGSLISVFNLTRDKDYSEINPINFKSLSLQEFKPKNKGYFWIENKHLVIPDSEVEMVSVMMLTADTSVNNQSSGNCVKILDREFPCLDYLLASVLELTTKQVMTSKQVPADEKSNLNSNIK